MSVRLIVTCDGCQARAPDGPIRRTGLTEYRNTLRESGWRVRESSRDFCPDCVEKLHLRRKPK